MTGIGEKICSKKTTPQLLPLPLPLGRIVLLLPPPTRGKKEKKKNIPLLNFLPFFPPLLLCRQSFLYKPPLGQLSRYIIPLYSTPAPHSSSSGSIYLPKTTTTEEPSPSSNKKPRFKLFIRYSFHIPPPSPTPSLRPLPCELKALITKPKRGIPFFLQISCRYI